MLFPCRPSSADLPGLRLELRAKYPVTLLMISISPAEDRGH